MGWIEMGKPDKIIISLNMQERKKENGNTFKEKIYLHVWTVHGWLFG